MWRLLCDLLFGNIGYKINGNIRNRNHSVVGIYLYSVLVLIQLAYILRQGEVAGPDEGG